MRFTLVLAMVAVTALAIGCGDKAKEMTEVMGNMKSIAESADDMQKDMDILEKRRQERVNKGDTMAMAPEELMKYLPDNISGYTAEEPEYESTDMGGFTMTQVHRSYNADDGKRVRVSLTDYNSYQMGWMGASAMFRMRFKTDNNREMTQTFSTDNEMINGYEKFDKKGNDVTVMYGIGGRFLLNISANQQSSTDWAKSVAGKMNLDKLADM